MKKSHFIWIVETSSDTVNNSRPDGNYYEPSKEVLFNQILMCQILNIRGLDDFTQTERLKAFFISNRKKLSKLTEFAI